MPSSIRTREDVIKDIKSLVQTEGYIYALCMILIEDFYRDTEKIHESNPFEEISTNEASFLLGFMVQNEINFTMPSHPFGIFELKKKTYELIKELHDSFMIPFQEKIEQWLNKEISNEEQNEPFAHAKYLVEPIFYGSPGVYDFQYLDLLSKKYKYDSDWLEKNKQFNIEKSKKIVIQIKKILERKLHGSGFYSLKDLEFGIDEAVQKYAPVNCPESELERTKQMAEMHQYYAFFIIPELEDPTLTQSEKRKLSWEAFYNRLIDLFIIRKTDFEQELNIGTFFENFSFSPGNNVNSIFQDIGNYNIINSQPLIKLDETRYFAPISFLLFEAIYESPYYWMFENDISYRPKLGENKGKVGEEITYEFLSKVFGEGNIFKGVKVKTLETESSTSRVKDATDIDILCVLGSKALCVQVKSKKLTLSARSGEDSKLKKDFGDAIQAPYEQGLISRKKILSRNSKFFTPDDREIILSEGIDDVYIMCVTLENYPALDAQFQYLLSKQESDPFPVALSVFDLELLAHYLFDPYDFMYYIRQRIALTGYFRADNEICYLAYHLQNKLWRMPDIDRIVIQNNVASSIDRNYYPLKAGLKVSDEGDSIKIAWNNKDFNLFCAHIKTLKQPKVTDIIFYLLDLSGEARQGFMSLIQDRKYHTSIDGKSHDGSIPPQENKDTRNLGLTFMSLAENDIEASKMLFEAFCLLRKYKSKADVWIGFAWLKGSSHIIDFIMLIEKPWQYDENLEKQTRLLLSKPGQVRVPKKIGRNEKCPCKLRNLKYKHCCGKNK